jgi:hypothetical protein
MRKNKNTNRFFKEAELQGVLILLLILAFQAPNLYSYSVLTHEAVVDSLWTDSILSPSITTRARPLPRRKIGRIGRSYSGSRRC